MSKKILLTLFIAAMAITGSYSQCSVTMADSAWGCPVTHNGGGSADIGPDFGLLDNIDGWTFSWYPTDGVSDPTAPRPHVWMEQYSGYKTYTLTITTPDCGTFVAGTVVVKLLDYHLSPIGPITYYNQYESTNSLVLTCDSPQFGWSKNGIFTGIGNQPLTISFSGDSTYTDYYTVFSSACYNQPTQTVAFTYHGCHYDSDYPTSNPSIYYSYGTCGPTLPATITQPVPGNNPTYYWNLYGSNNAYWSITSPSDNSATLSRSGGTAPTSEGIHTIAIADDGTEIHMNWGVGVFTSANCTLSTHPVNTSANVIRETTIGVAVFPNPAKAEATITADDLIESVEIIDIAGRTMKAIAIIAPNKVVKTSVGGFSAGVYLCKVQTAGGMRIVKLVVAK